MPADDQLFGWKAIAGYLGVGLRTAQDYEKDRGLPVYHQPGAKGRVFASANDLDQWRKSSSSLSPANPPPEVMSTTTGAIWQNSTPTLSRPRRHVRLWICLAITVGAIATFALVEAGHLKPKEPSRVQLKGRVLEMLDQEDHPMWRFTLPGRPAPIPAPADYENALPVIADIDGDGKKELLYNFHEVTEAREGKADTLYCFGSEGRVCWTRQIGRELRASTGQIYPKHYTLVWITKLNHPTPSGGIIAVGGHRGGTSLFCVELLTKDGQVVGEYYHPGWLWANAVMDLDQDGYSEIILGGVNDAYGNLPGFEYPMTLVVLDSRAVEGEGPAPDGDTRHFPGLPSGRERAVLLLRNFGQMPSDAPTHFCLFAFIMPREGHIEARAFKLGSNGRIATDYQFDRHLNVEFALPSDLLATMLHSKLRHPPTDAERSQFYLKELGDTKVLKNDFATH